MEVVRPEFVPDASLSREGMERLQGDIAEAAVFADDFGFDTAAVRVDGGSRTAGSAQTQIGDAKPDATEAEGRPLVAGFDQAFRDGKAISAAVVLRGGDVVERAHAVEPVEIPYIPGLLSFREGKAILSALSALEREPDLVFVDGNGRIHFREAGLATHVGATVDAPTVGVAKNLLCGRPRESLSEPLPEGRRVAIEADDEMTTPEGTVVGYAVQTRQYDSDSRHVNPVYASPGHRVGAESAADVVEQCAAGYKLPEPTRLADSYADEVKRGL